MKNKIKYIVIAIVLMGGLYFFQASRNTDDTPVKNGEIQVDENGKQIIDRKAKGNQDKEDVKGKIDKSTLTQEELEEYENYDLLGKNAKDQEMQGKK